MNAHSYKFFGTTHRDFLEEFEAALAAKQNYELDPASLHFLVRSMNAMQDSLNGSIRINDHFRQQTNRCLGFLECVYRAIDLHTSVGDEVRSILPEIEIFLDRHQ